MKNSIFIGVFLLSLMGCTTEKTIQGSNLSLKQVEAVKIGSEKSNVISFLGNSYKDSPPLNEKDHEGWLYYNADENHWQRAAILFDSRSQLVISKIFIPLEGESEYSLDFLLQKKFSGLKFEYARLQRCNRDFVPSEAYYINVANGVVIKIQTVRKNVESIVWMSSEDAARRLEQIKFCQI